MEGIKLLRSTQIIILGVCFVIATIVSTMILSNGLLKVKQFSSQVISVTGSAEKKIVSDYIVWQAEFSRRDPVLKSAYNGLQEDLKAVKGYMFLKGIKEDELTISPVYTKTLYRKNERGHDTNEIEAYELSCVVEIKSYDVIRVDNISRMSTELIDAGIRFISSPPQFFYTKLSDLKVEMLSMATEDAKRRAVSMADSTKNKIGAIRSARMGVFQIVPVTSTDVSWYGENDTSSLEKKVVAVVSAVFAVE
ncbi:MAG: SIMPL domain-containing protein [Candidatus Omnitrophica bacterium]|nr:SIMPL domain-containing protein [Candidatus Omnitrophota bacterium]